MKEKSESEVAQLCSTLSDPMDCSLPGSSVLGFSRQEYWSGVPFPSPKKDLNDPDNHNGVITHLEPDILEREVKWALGSITTNKASGGDGIPVSSFKY